MAGDEKHFVVFHCQACNARIFAEAKQIGRAGVCPACRQMTGVAPKDPNARVSGPPTTAPGKKKLGSPSSGRVSPGERRRARRIPLADGKVGLESRQGRPVSPLDLAELADISETGIGYLAPGEKDRKRLSGYGPPALRVGEVITITLQVPALFRPRTLKAVVRRIDAHATRKDVFRVGAEFVGLPDDARADLRKLVERRPPTNG